MATKYIKIKIEGILPVHPDLGPGDLDVAAERGLDVFKGLLRQQVKNIVPGTIAGSWQSMPSSWQPKKDTSPQPGKTRGSGPGGMALPDEVNITSGRIIDQIPVGVDGEVSFVEDVMGAGGAVTHPWDQGLYIFPEGHPVREVEEEFRRQYMSSTDGTYKRSLKEGVQQVNEGFMKELEAGDGTDSE